MTLRIHSEDARREVLERTPIEKKRKNPTDTTNTSSRTRLLEDTLGCRLRAVEISGTGLRRRGPGGRRQVRSEIPTRHLPGPGRPRLTLPDPCTTRQAHARTRSLSLAQLAPVCLSPWSPCTSRRAHLLALRNHYLSACVTPSPPPTPPTHQHTCCCCRYYVVAG